MQGTAVGLVAQSLGDAVRDKAVAVLALALTSPSDMYGWLHITRMVVPLISPSGQLHAYHLLHVQLMLLQTVVSNLLLCLPWLARPHAAVQTVPACGSIVLLIDMLICNLGRALPNKLTHVLHVSDLQLTVPCRDDAAPDSHIWLEAKGTALRCKSYWPMSVLEMLCAMQHQGRYHVYVVLNMASTPSAT